MAHEPWPDEPSSRAAVFAASWPRLDALAPVALASIAIERAFSWMAASPPRVGRIFRFHPAPLLPREAAGSDNSSK
jgi:hypothetical protein